MPRTPFSNLETNRLSNAFTRQPMPQHVPVPTTGNRIVEAMKARATRLCEFLKRVHQIYVSDRIPARKLPDPAIPVEQVTPSRISQKFLAVFPVRVNLMARRHTKEKKVQPLLANVLSYPSNRRLRKAPSLRKSRIDRRPAKSSPAVLPNGERRPTIRFTPEFHRQLEDPRALNRLPTQSPQSRGPRTKLRRSLKRIVEYELPRLVVYVKRLETGCAIAGMIILNVVSDKG